MWSLLYGLKVLSNLLREGTGGDCRFLLGLSLFLQMPKYEVLKNTALLSGITISTLSLVAELTFLTAKKCVDKD